MHWPSSVGSDCSWLLLTCEHTTEGQKTIRSLQLSHIERLEVRALAELGGKRLQLVVADL